MWFNSSNDREQKKPKNRDDIYYEADVTGILATAIKMGFEPAGNGIGRFRLNGDVPVILSLCDRWDSGYGFHKPYRLRYASLACDQNIPNLNLSFSLNKPAELGPCVHKLRQMYEIATRDT